MRLSEAIYKPINEIIQHWNQVFRYFSRNTISIGLQTKKTNLVNAVCLRNSNTQIENDSTLTRSWRRNLCDKIG